MVDGDAERDASGYEIPTDRQHEMAMRIGFYMAVILFFIILFMYIASMGSENETTMLLIFIGSMVPMLGTYYLWRRAYWRMRRAALEDGYE
jgi:ABC-type nickel/cobalt efflux system permease component RcnA